MSTLRRCKAAARSVEPLRLLHLLLAVTAGTSSAQVGNNYCTATPNSTGVPASIAATGSAVVPLNDLVLRGSNLPLGSTAYFLCSRSPGFVANPGGSAGNLCLASPIGRQVGGLITNSGTTGTVAVAAELYLLPQPSGPAVAIPGETWRFQCWFRDTSGSGAPTSNFTDGLEVLFQGGGGPNPGFVLVPAGTFPMGSNASSNAPYFSSTLEKPVHQVTISQDFWIGRYEVTQAEYQALMGSNPSYFPGAPRPVDSVSWHEARAYCAALTAQQAGNLPVGYEYRLPTEAEWEYAYRAGTTSEYHQGATLGCDQARFGWSLHTQASCSSHGSLPVGTYAPNALGLYDMSGNLSEWCLDVMSQYPSGPVTDPFTTGNFERVVRGGEWVNSSQLCRAAARMTLAASIGSFQTGFRVVLAPIRVP